MMIVMAGSMKAYDEVVAQRVEQAQNTVPVAVGLAAQHALPEGSDAMEWMMTATVVSMRTGPPKVALAMLVEETADAQDDIFATPARPV